MGYTCERCNGMGILNYDSDLPRYKQERCPDCEGEGVLYEEEKKDRHCILEPLKTIGLDDEEFFRYVKGLEKEVESKVFTLRMSEGDNTENPYVQVLFVFEDKQILEVKISAKGVGEHWQIQAKGGWL